jgi:periplasmic protein TonB
MSMGLDQGDGHPGGFPWINVATIGTDAAFSAIAEARSELLRWLLSGALILVAYTALASALIHWHQLDEPDETAAALVIDLAPVPVAPTNIQSDVPPEPEHEEVPPEEPVERVEEPELKPDIIPDVKPEIVIPQPIPEPEPTPKEEAPPPPPAPQVPKAVEAPVAAAPSQGKLSTSNSNAVPAWKRQVANLLERNKRYPAAAQQRGERGVTEISFSVDRQGRVMSSHIVRSSGSAALDQATLDLVRRVQPFPAPPSEMAGAQIELIVPIRFKMN